VQLLEPLAKFDRALPQHLLRPPLVEGSPDEHHQLLGIVRFLHVSIGTQVDRLDGRLLRSVAGQNDAFDGPVSFLNRLDQVYT
jgi:hypothetical protein